MIPNNENYDDGQDDDERDFILQTEPSLTYAMKVNPDETKDSVFVGKVDGTEAIRQAVLKILNTERYENEIYSWDYGIELRDLFGMPMEYVMSEIKTRIEDALLEDDRIEAVDEFEVERSGKRTVHCSFTVTTVQGEEIEEETEIDI